MTIEGENKSETKKPLGLKAAQRGEQSANNSQALEEMKKIVLPEGAEEDELQELLAVFMASKEAEETENEENAILLTRATIHECDRLLKAECAAAVGKPLFYFIYATALFDLVLSDTGSDEKDLMGFLELAEEMVNKGLALDPAFGDLYVIGTEIALQQGFNELIALDQPEEVSKATDKVMALVRRFGDSPVENKHSYFLEITTSLSMHLDDYAEYEPVVGKLCAVMMEVGDKIYTEAEKREKAVSLLEIGSVLSNFFNDDGADEEDEWEDEEDDEAEEEAEEEDIEESDSDSVKESLALERQMFGRFAKQFIDAAIENINSVVASDEDAEKKGSSLVMLTEAYVLRGNLDLEGGETDYRKAIETFETCKKVCPDVITEEVEESIQSLKEDFAA